MSERERWIVYPLLFFALGAAIRDKLFHQVVSKEMACERLIVGEIECRGEIVARQIHGGNVVAQSLTAGGIDCEGGVKCQGVVVFDRDKPALRLVELGSAAPRKKSAGEPNDNFGVLVLRDSQGKALCGVSNDELYVKKVVCESASVVAPNQLANPLVRLGTVEATFRQQNSDKPAESRPFGYITVNQQTYSGAPGKGFGPLMQTTPSTEKPPVEKQPAPAETSPAEAAPKS